MPGTKLMLQMGRIVEDQFESYMKIVHPADITDDVRKEVRKTFFAGVTVMVGMLEIIGKDEINDEDSGDLLESIRDECIRFNQGQPPIEPKPFIWSPIKNN